MRYNPIRDLSVNSKHKSPTGSCYVYANRILKLGGHEVNMQDILIDQNISTTFITIPFTSSDYKSGFNCCLYKIL